MMDSIRFLIGTVTLFLFPNEEEAGFSATSMNDTRQIGEGIFHAIPFNDGYLVTDGRLWSDSNGSLDHYMDTPGLKQELDSALAAVLP